MDVTQHRRFSTRQPIPAFNPIADRSPSWITLPLIKAYINIHIPLIINVRGYSSVVEHPTADRAVPGSNPGAP